jgi:hypothetical protein
MIQVNKVEHIIRIVMELERATDRSMFQGEIARRVYMTTQGVLGIMNTTLKNTVIITPVHQKDNYGNLQHYKFYTLKPKVTLEWVTEQLKELTDSKTYEKIPKIIEQINQYRREQ